tara:strand:+ start:1272 stop:1463 length:192 start_codon:yes stop_codon:yes gene_type:complete
MEYDLIPENILEDLINRGLTREDIENSTPQKLFDEYLAWNGFIGWAGTFADAIDDLRSAQKAI